MKKIFLGTTLALTLAATSAMARTMISEVEVEADLTAIQDMDAAQNWSNLSADLENAIAQRLVNRISEEGASIVIDIDELELANIFETQMGVESSVLAGEVNVKVPGILNNDKYTLTVSAKQATPYLPAGSDTKVITTSSTEFYEAMVGAFAENVVENLR
ncbi:hypothetical protein [Parasulfitobacter algicola]|uniref:Uncharacterized protein n=1 Tax=Parasulfitobacter algicola TaxID=2614809 RepID=A0ABX2IW87_9RHOB|nr:hypothetical protein [Sulfitobacter algicola]NSX54576.1 hypothetical protein [Sulfitobacter algicola]